MPPKSIIDQPIRLAFRLPSGVLRLEPMSWLLLDP